MMDAMNAVNNDKVVGCVTMAVLLGPCYGSIKVAPGWQYGECFGRPDRSRTGTQKQKEKC